MKEREQGKRSWGGGPRSHLGDQEVELIQHGALLQLGTEKLSGLGKPTHPTGIPQGRVMCLSFTYILYVYFHDGHLKNSLLVQLSIKASVLGCVPF